MCLPLRCGPSSYNVPWCPASQLPAPTVQKKPCFLCCIAGDYFLPTVPSSKQIFPLVYGANLNNSATLYTRQKSQKPKLLFLVEQSPLYMQWYSRAQRQPKLEWEHFGSHILSTKSSDPQAANEFPVSSACPQKSFIFLNRHSKV